MLQHRIDYSADPCPTRNNQHGENADRIEQKRRCDTASGSERGLTQPEMTLSIKKPTERSVLWGFFTNRQNGSYGFNILRGFKGNF